MFIYIVGVPLAIFIATLVIIVEWKEGMDKTLLECIMILLVAGLFSWISVVILGCMLIHYLAMVASSITIRGKGNK